MAGIQVLLARYGAAFHPPTFDVCLFCASDWYCQVTYLAEISMLLHAASPILVSMVVTCVACAQKPLVVTLWAAAIVFVVRLAAIFMGSWLGAFIGGTPAEHRRKIWQGMVTQVRKVSFDPPCLALASFPSSCCGCADRADMSASLPVPTEAVSENRQRCCAE